VLDSCPESWNKVFEVAEAGSSEQQPA